jgi:hypothetical protein
MAPLISTFSTHPQGANYFLLTNTALRRIKLLG